MKIALALFILIALGLSIWILLVRHWVARYRSRGLRPCFRCALVATEEFMALPYCAVCRIAVSRMLSAVRHDPPYGFPGGPGYLEFPRKQSASEIVEGKKEI